jgi:DNA repair exonuclease SbcCD nuclease subunit
MSFRFLHTGDLHLDSPFVGLTIEAPVAVAETLREATLRSWQTIVQLAIDERVDFVLVAGDVFEQANRTLRGQIRFRDGLAVLARAIEELATRQQVMYFTCHPETPLRGALEISLPRLRTVADAVAAPV